MVITVELIADCLVRKGIDFTVCGNDISAHKLSAIGPRVRHSVCYYEGENPEDLAGVDSSIIFCKPELNPDHQASNIYIKTRHPQLSFYYTSSLAEDPPEVGIHEKSVIDKSAVIGSEVSIGPFCTVEACTIGNGVIIESGVKIHKGTVIGNNVHIQTNSVIGPIGVMWAWDAEGNKVRCVPHGRVFIEDRVFIGSNISIVRGAFENKPTIIGRDTMIAHGTMIGHGVEVGPSNHFANNVSLGGSVRTGKNCFFGSGATVRPHTVMPDNTTVGAGAVVVKNFTQAGLTLIGNPAKGIDAKREKQTGVPARPTP